MESGLRAGGPGGTLTERRELLAGGRGCDFPGPEQGSLGRPLEQLGQEFTPWRCLRSEAGLS